MSDLINHLRTFLERRDLCAAFDPGKKPANGQWKRCGSFLKRICLSLKLDASENCRKNAEFLEFEMLFVGFLALTKIWRTQKMMKGGVMGDLC